MSDERIAMIFGHPGHELTVLGLIERLRPYVLYVTKADSSGSGKSREALARGVLHQYGIGDRVEFLGVSERDSHASFFSGNVAFFTHVRDQICDWLLRVRPVAVMGDAFELYNINHDLTRMLIDSSIIMIPPFRRPSNFEIALCCRTANDLHTLNYQNFPSGPFVNIDLSPGELMRKRSAIAWCSEQIPYIGALASNYTMERETYRPVPVNRNYSVMPPHLKPHYDEWGAEQVRRGKYKRVLTFAEHFAPIARSLGEAPASAAA